MTTSTEKDLLPCYKNPLSSLLKAVEGTGLRTEEATSFVFKSSRLSEGKKYVQARVITLEVTLKYGLVHLLRLFDTDVREHIRKMNSPILCIIRVNKS